MRTSLQIAREAHVAPIVEVAQTLGIPDRFLEPYGRTRARIDPDLLSEPVQRRPGRYVLVTAITPTPLGEGKTTTAIGLGMALERLGKKAIVTLRQSSLGPVFGIKGGGAGGGYAQVAPLEDSILHVTGDIHAISQAHNQIAAMTDNAWFHGTVPGIDPDWILMRRALDVNDRFLRDIVVSPGGSQAAFRRRTGFDITAASELMAILALVDGHSRREVLQDLRSRIGRMVVAFDQSGVPVTADEVRAAGAATVLMRETIKPTLMQTLEQTPVLIHAGPFGNIAHGSSSIIADRIGLRLADYVVTEAGFGMDLGGEKFFDIKCRTSGLEPAVAVVVVTIRALKAHSGNYPISAGKPLPSALMAENPEDVVRGGLNLRRQLELLERFGVPAVVALNAFPEDHPSEVEAVRRIAAECGARDMAISRAFSEGGQGALELASSVIDAAERGGPLKLLYPLELSIREKIDVLATRVYGASAVDWSLSALEQLARFEATGFGRLPICMAKTHLSISHDPRLKGAPEGYRFPIRELRLRAGAGFLCALAGDMMTMPGLGADPAGGHVDIDENGDTIGLF